MTCLGASAICHTYYPLSPQYSKWVSRGDYAGIAVLIAGSYYPPIFYGLPCSTVLKRLYVSVISVVAMLMVAMMMHEKYAQNDYASTRTMLFIALGFGGIVP